MARIDEADRDEPFKRLCKDSQEEREQGPEKY